MTMPDYWAMMSRITPHRADEIDDLTARFDPHAPARGREVFPALAAVPFPEPRFKRDDAICVGFRVAGELPGAAERALRLAALALERDVEVIILSQDGRAGLERFGFRVELIPDAAADPQGDWTEQIRRFWGLDQTL